QAEDGIRDPLVTGVQTCALPISLRAKGDIDATKSEYKHAWLLDPLDDAPHNALGELLLDRREFNEAESEFRKAIELAPASPTERSEERRVGKGVVLGDVR